MGSHRTVRNERDCFVFVCLLDPRIILTRTTGVGKGSEGDHVLQQYHVLQQ